MVGFIVLASLLLLPHALSDDLAPGRTLLIETVDEPEPETKHHNDENIINKRTNCPLNTFLVMTMVMTIASNGIRMGKSLLIISVQVSQIQIVLKLTILV